MTAAIHDPKPFEHIELAMGTGFSFHGRSALSDSDTSIILKWLQTEYDAEVVTFTADLGQGGELEPARKKAEMLGIKDIYIEDLREEFVKDFVFPMFRANALYEGEYLLGTSIARPLIAKRLIEIANETGSQAISHGATGKGNERLQLSPWVRLFF